jgi:hypothetical protein
MITPIQTIKARRVTRMTEADLSAASGVSQVEDAQPDRPPQYRPRCWATSTFFNRLRPSDCDCTSAQAQGRGRPCIRDVMLLAPPFKALSAIAPWHPCMKPRRLPAKAIRLGYLSPWLVSGRRSVMQTMKVDC